MVCNPAYTSLAIWYCENTTENTNTPTTMDVHINLWRLRSSSWWSNSWWPKQKKEVHFFEIGMLIHDKKDLDSINIFLPCDVNSDDISDVCRKIYAPRLAGAIFNTPVKVERGEDNMFCIKDKVNQHVWNCYCLSISQDIQFQTVKLDSTNVNGTQLTIPSKVISRFKDKNCYLRVRIELTPSLSKVFCKEYSPKDKKLFSSFKKTDVVSVSINECRNLPPEINQKFKDTGTNVFDIRKVQYLLVRNIHDEFIMAHENLHRCRMLETHIWDDYVGSDSSNVILNGGVLVYHWKAEAAGQNIAMEYNALAKFSRREVSPLTIVVFLLIIIFLGMLGSLSADVIESFYSKAPARQTH